MSINTSKQILEVVSSRAVVITAVVFRLI